MHKAGFNCMQDSPKNKSSKEYTQNKNLVEKFHQIQRGSNKNSQYKTDLSLAI